MGLRRKLRKLIPKEIAGVLEIGAPFAAASVGGPWGAALGATMGGLGSLKRTGKFSPKSMAIGALGSAGPEWGTTREGKGLERFFSKEPSYLKNIWANRADYMPDWLTEERKWLPIKGVEGGEYSIATKLGSMIMTPEMAVGVGLGVYQYIEAKKREKEDKGLGYTTEDYEADVADYYSAYESSFEKGFAAQGGRAGYDFAKGGIAGLKKGGRIGYKHGAIDLFPWPSYKDHSELEEEEYRDMSSKELEALREKDEDDWLANYILTERLQKEIGGDYWPFLGIDYKKKDAGANMIEELQGYKYGKEQYEGSQQLPDLTDPLSMEDAITDLENKWDIAIEEGFEPGRTRKGFKNLWIWDKEDIRKRIERGWGHVKLEDDTGTATGARGGIAGLKKGGRTKYAFGRGPVLPELLETQEQLPISDILGETGVQVDEQVDYEGPGRGIEGIATEGIERHTASSRIGDLMRLLEEAMSKNDFDKANQIRSDLYREYGIQMKKGGRIGYSEGNSKDPSDKPKSKSKPKHIDLGDLEGTNLGELIEDIIKWKDEKAQGGRIKKAPGGLMNLGGMEKDYRQTGGFVPIGKKEKADDVPARLSKNEFVMTADAVRAAGGGNINKGAQRMYNTMKQLEGKRA